MAATKTRAAPVGSAQWIRDEKDNAGQLIDQDVEEFSFSVRNEFEWLNEHMADVFSKNNVNFADVFKTPGKLRGKTPRTARKRDALAPRQPLTDIFAPDPQVAPTNPFYEKVAHFQIAEDQENAPEHRPTSRSKSPQRVGKPGNTDSGYHGMTEDEMELDARTETATSTSNSSQEKENEPQKVPLREDQPRPQPLRQDTAATVGGRTSDESFMSAKEDLPSRNASRARSRDENEQVENEGDDNATVPDEEMGVDEPEVSETPAAQPVVYEDEAEPMEQEDMDEETPRSPSDASSPEKPLQRKSSFTFSALPAREPLTAKRSIGGRNSQIDAGRNSVLAGRSQMGKSFGIAQDEEDVYSQEKPEEARMHSKTSTQSLHERIMMLGKTKEPRTSKSIPQSVLGAQAVYPQLPSAEAEAEVAADVPDVPPRVSAHDFAVEAEAEEEDDDDDWIAPSKPMQPAQHKAVAQLARSTTPAGSPTRPPMHQKSISATAVPSPARPITAGGHQKAQSVSNPSLANAAGVIQSTTPAGTPMKKHHDGPLSASKNKLWSALRSAKNIFASSASASAAAKMEAQNHSPQRSPKRDISDEFKTAAVYNMPGALYSHAQLPPSPTKAPSVISASPSRKTRSSTENERKRERETEAQQKVADKLEKARAKEQQKAAKQQEERRRADEAEAAKRAEKERLQAAERPASADSEEMKDTLQDMPPPPPPKSMLPAGKLRAPARLLKPSREQQQTAAARPAPVNIRVASQSQRLGQAAPQSSFSKSQHESVAPPPPPKTGLRTASAQATVRGSSAQPQSNARVRALEAAARKKEADDKAAQKKADAKRELERKRAAKAEEERRAEEERKAAEQARIQEAKREQARKAEQQAAEARKREQARLEQQITQEEAERQKARAAHELAEAIKRERAASAQAPAHQRGDIGGTLRQLAKNTVQPNPKMPAKRVFQPEEDEQYASQPQRPGMHRGPASYQQNDAKRRRTIDEQEERDERHSVMAPPKRPSNMRKESTLNKFPHGYTHAPPPATHHTASMFKSTVTAQHQLQHAGKAIPTHPSQTVQMSNARIPFAENANPPATAQHQAHVQQTYYGSENAQPGTAAANNKFKTPARPTQNPKSAKSSPMYPKGDNIELPEIQTDSEEEEDSEDEGPTGGFRAPSWVASPALRELLTSQQLVDPESVFGPIGELKMEEVFKGAKADRVKKFRDRGSSAAWVTSGDAITSAEKRRDMEMREKVVREGGWRFEPNA